MNKLNCSIGDLAITVKANLPANLGYQMDEIFDSEPIQQELFLEDVEEEAHS